MIAKTLVSFFHFSLLTILVGLPNAVKADNYGGYKDVIFYKNGEVETIEFHKGKYIVLNFWATWCPYCKMQLPAFSLLKDRYKDNDNVEIIALSTDNGGFETVSAYLKKTGIQNLDIYHDKDRNLFRSLGIRGVPTILLLDKEGDIIETYNGMKYLDLNYLDELFK